MRRGLMLVVLVLAVVAVVFALLSPGCDGEDDNDNGSEPPTTPAPNDAEMADLAVTFVRVYPGSPSLGHAFTVRAQVGNLGDAASDTYDIAGTVRNVSTGVVYPVGAKTMDPMQPGEDYVALQNDNVNVADAGSYQFWLEISPWGDDADPSNDTAGWSFTVSD